MTMLTKEQIISAKDRKTKVVEVPEWGGSVTVATLTASDRLALQMMTLDAAGKPRPPAEISRIMTVGLCAFAIIDEAGERMFSNEEIEALGKKSIEAIERVFVAADELNGISQQMGAAVRKN